MNAVCDRCGKHHAPVAIRLIAIPFAAEKSCPVCHGRMEGILVLSPECRPPKPGDVTACQSCHTPLTFGKEGFELCDESHIERLNPRHREMFMMMLQSRAMDAGMRAH